MIVADANVGIYLVYETSFSPMARLVFGKDSDWVVPPDGWGADPFSWPEDWMIQKILLQYIKWQGEAEVDMAYEYIGTKIDGTVTWEQTFPYIAPSP